MKKLLLLILIALVLTLTIFTVVNGFQIAGLEVLGIKQIQIKSEDLQGTVEKATRLATTDFPEKENEITESIKELEEQKTTYEDMVAVSSTEDVQSARQIPNYEVGYLWTRVGLHATAEGVNIRMNIVNGSGGAYNLKFTVDGSYVGISEFITDIEDDSALGFKIEEFSMKPGSSDNNLQATFVCKNINITGMSETTPETTDSSNNANTNNTNTTNTTNNNTNNTTNTANTNNTTNTTNTTNTVNTVKVND